MNVPFWYPKREYQALKPEIDAAVQKVQSESDLIRGPDLDRFELRMAHLLGTQAFVGVGSGTDALILSLRALGIKQGHEVITTSYTFRATVDAILHVGATPILTDIDEDWKPYKTPNTKAIIPVHIAGEATPWTPTPDIVMIEDACQAVTASSVRGTTACYSFYPAKILGCHGQAGGIATNDTLLAENLRAMSNLYKDSGETLGYNSRLDNLQAAILNVKLDHFDQSIRIRKEVAELYDSNLPLHVTTPTPRKVYQDYIIYTTYARELKDYLSSRGVETLLNIYRFPDAYPKRPQSILYEQNTLRLPCHPYLTEDEVYYVIDSIRDFFSQHD